MNPSRTSASTRLVVVSILNWNTAELTLKCVEALRSLVVPEGMSMEIIVIDNGSAGDDFSRLRIGLPTLAALTLKRHEVNLGFAGGNNVAIAMAHQRKAEFVWLLNSDAVVDQPLTLVRMIETMDNVARCGAVSPKLTIPAAPHHAYFSGWHHDWSRRLTVRTEEAQSRLDEESMPFDMWLPGTALMLRLAALKEVGPLDERFFAYYEDDEICARLAAAGWVSRVAFDVAVKHSMPRAETDRPPYYFYLIQRNYLIFWFKHTPPKFRRLLWLRLIDQALFEINKLKRKNFPEHSAAATLGMLDFLSRTSGAPDLTRRPPTWIKLVIRIAESVQERALRRVLEADASQIARQRRAL